MRSSLNLRGDLAKLSDIELPERLEAAWQTYELANKRWPGWWMRPSGWRGPFQHPRAYRFLSALGSSSGNGWFDFVFAAMLNGKWAEPFLRRADPSADSHLALCEIQDLTDEMERRVAQRRAAKGATDDTRSELRPG